MVKKQRKHSSAKEDAAKKQLVNQPPMTVHQLYDGLKEELHMRLLTKEGELNRRIRSSEIHRPGLAFSGFYDYFAYDRVQILGKTEITYLSHLSEREWKKNFEKFFKYRIPCIVVAKNQNLPGDLLARAESAGVPVFKSPLKTSTIASRVTVFIEDFLAPETTLHGTLLDIYGVGTILLGESGVGKSECALELISRGHRLVADDAVKIRLVSGRIPMGVSSKVIKHHMEIRGLGIIDVTSMFGVGAVRNRKRISLVVTLERWQEGFEYDRLGLDELVFDLLGVRVPHLKLPVKPGRNIPVLIEAAALSQRSKRMGRNFPKELNEHLLRTMNGSEKADEA
ncbi:MAG: HPr kinase/phosphorylase [Candidatus Omnitrophica bacterium]|nr:HPr kinase/phosphorylase [Candidatus Omnitrophota bacterium]